MEGERKEIYRDDKVVVDLVHDPKDGVCIYAHRVEDGVECIPRAYMLGYNSLMLPKRL